MPHSTPSLPTRDCNDNTAVKQGCLLLLRLREDQWSCDEEGRLVRAAPGLASNSQKEIGACHYCGSMKFSYGSGCGSIPLTNGSGCGSWSCHFRQWSSRCHQKLNFLSFFAHYFLKIHLHHFSKIKIIKKSKTVGINVFFTMFAWW